MLQSMRSGAKSPIMKFFLLFLAGGFALWGIGDGSTGLIGGSDKAISAGEQNFSPRDVAIEFDRTRRAYLPNTTNAEAVQGGLLNEVVGNMSRELLFLAENEELGLTVTRAMQRAAIANEASFQDEFGQFSEGRFMQALASAGYTEQDYLNRVDNVLRRQQLISPIFQGLSYDRELAKVVAKHDMEKRTVKLISFAVQSESVATPNDAAIDSFFQENKSSYDAPRLRTARIGSISAALIAKEITISDGDVKAAFDDRVDEFSTPETRSIRQMVFEDQVSANAARDRLDTGEDFISVAASMLNWTDDDTKLGTVTEANLDSALAAPAFAAETGAIIGPLETAFGFHLLSIESITAAGVTQLDDVREKIINTLRGERAINLLYERVNILEDALSSGATINEAISKVDGQLDIASNIDRQGQTLDADPATIEPSELLQDSAILDSIWEGELNEISVIQEGSDDLFFVVEVVDETEQRERNLEEVKPLVISDYKVVEAIKSARALAETAATAPSTHQNTTLSPAFRRNGIGLDHEAAGLIARAAFEQGVGDVRVVETGIEVIAVQTIEVIHATNKELQDTVEMVLTVMNSALQTDMTNLLLMSLSQKHNLQLNMPTVQELLLGSTQ